MLQGGGGAGGDGGGGETVEEDEKLNIARMQPRRPRKKGKVKKKEVNL